MVYSRGDNFIFEGFSPSDDLKIYGQEVYNRVEGKAPSESTKKACISKTNKGYQGSFCVTSASGIFKVDSESKEPKGLIDKLYQKMELQILDWNKARDPR